MASTELITLEQVEDVLLHGGGLEVVDSEAMQEDMVRRVLASESLADAFADFKSVPARDIEGQVILVKGVAWVQSSFEQGPGVYALLRCDIDGTGEDVVVSMGGRTLMASFVWAQRHEAMPMRGAFVSYPSRANPEYRYWTFKLAKS